MSEKLRHWDYCKNNIDINPILDKENKDFLDTIESILNKI